MSIDAVGFEFFSTIGVTPLAGREFTRAFPADTLRGVMINEAACREFGWTPETAIGKAIRVGDIVREGEVIGVLPDFNFGSLHQKVSPIVISYPRTRLQDVYVRFNTSSTEDVIAAVAHEWKTILPELPFDYIFLEDHLSSLYNDDRKFGDMFQFFAVVALVIACLGLYGIIDQTVIYRTKEIGIRKVLGAGVSGIMLQVLREFLILILCAGVLAAPVSYWITEQWLSDFSYRIAVPIFVFPLAALAVMMLAVLTVSGLSLKAALTNPVDALRSDG